MKTSVFLVLGSISAAMACNVTNARGITINSWGQSPFGTETILPAATSASTTNLSEIGISTPIDLSFTPGVTSAPIYNDTGGGTDLEEFAWGGNAYISTPTAQVILAGTSATTFQLSIGYSDPNVSDLYSASVLVGGITYTASLTSDFSDAPDNYLNLSDASGAWKVVGESDNGWKESPGPSAAPEIDSSSAISALTLLAGAIAILRGGPHRPRRLAARA